MQMRETEGGIFIFGEGGASFKPEKNLHGTGGKDGTCHGGSREQVKTCGRRRTGRERKGTQGSRGRGEELMHFLICFRQERVLPGVSIVDLLFTFSYCIVLHAFSLMSLAFIHCLDATFLLLSRFFFYDFHLRIFMHMRASESHIYSLSFPVRGAWSMHRYLYLSLTSSRSYPHVFTVRSAHLHPIYIPCITPLCIHTCPYLNHTS